MRERSTGRLAYLFEATEPALFLDYFRIPYQPADRSEPLRPGLSSGHPLQECGLVRHPANGAKRSLAWVLGEALAAHGIEPRASRLGSIPIFAAVLPDEIAADWLIAA